MEKKENSFEESRYRRVMHQKKSPLDHSYPLPAKKPRNFSWEATYSESEVSLRN